MTQLTALQELAEKVETGAPLLVGGSVAAMGAFWRHSTVNHIAPAYNGSLDAAKALHEAVVPDWQMSVDQMKDGWDVDLQVPGSDPYLSVSNVADKAACRKDLARAWLLAIIRAKIAELEGQ